MATSPIPTTNLADPNAGISAAARTAVSTKNDAGSADRFLKLLVAQMKNQDPLNPMDNAQVTSQMAQINTVTGIENLNTSVKALDGRFLQQQALQGASLVGHDVTLPGNQLQIDSNGIGRGAFDLAGSVDRATVEILDGSGRVVATQNIGAAGSGINDFAWNAGNAADGQNYRFRVSAKAGANDVAPTLLMRDRVESVSLAGNSLQLELSKSGSVAYDKVRSFN